MDRYTHLSRNDLILLHTQSAAALAVSDSYQLKSFVKNFFDNTFPVSNSACLAFDTYTTGYRLLALHNFGFPGEREEAFRKKGRIANCGAILSHKDIVVNIWNRKHKNLSSSAHLIGEDAARYDIHAGLYGAIAPRQGMAGVLCSLAGEEVTLDPRYLELLQCWMPYFQLAQSRVLKEHEEETTDDVGLTKREIDVLRWLSKGKTNWEMGRILGISESTVKFHVSNLSVKLGASNRAHVVALAQDILRLS